MYLDKLEFEKGVGLMKKKYILLISSFITMISIFWVADTIRDNYKLGQEMYDVTIRLESQCYEYAKSIDFLQQEFSKEEVREGYITHSFESSMLVFHSYFGYENVPILDESRVAWARQFDEIFDLFVNKPSEQYKTIFENRADEMNEFKNQMYSMAEEFGDFRDNYSKLSVWERYFTSWKKERIKLTDEVGLP